MHAWRCIHGAQCMAMHGILHRSKSLHPICRGTSPADVRRRGSLTAVMLSLLPVHARRCAVPLSDTPLTPPPLVQTINDYPGVWLSSGIKEPIKLKLIKSAATQVGCKEGGVHHSRVVTLALSFIPSPTAKSVDHASGERSGPYVCMVGGTHTCPRG